MNRLWTIPVVFTTALTFVLPGGAPYPASISMMDRFMGTMGEYEEGALLGKRGPLWDLPDPILHPLNRLLHDERMAFDPLYTEFQQACGDPWPVFAGAVGRGATALSSVRDSVIFGGNCTEDDGDEWDGKVIFVTNTNDSGTGSLRAAFDSIQDGRYEAMIFTTGGRIDFATDLDTWEDGDFQLFGQSAPGEGINVTTKPLVCSGSGGPVDDFAIRFISLQVTFLQSYSCRNGTRHMIDHISTVYCADNTGSRNCIDMTVQDDLGRSLTDVTISHSICGFSRYDHPTCWAGSIFPRPDSSVVSLESLENHSFVRNALCWSSHRCPNPSWDSEVIQNFWYGWDSRIAAMGNGGCYRVNFVGNYSDNRGGGDGNDIVMAGDWDVSQFGDYNQTNWENLCEEPDGQHGPVVFFDEHRHNGTSTSFQVIDVADIYDEDVFGAGTLAHCRAGGGTDWCPIGGIDTIPTLMRSSTPVIPDTAEFSTEEAGMHTAMTDALRDSLLDASLIGVGKSQRVDSLGQIVVARLPADTLMIHQAQNQLGAECPDGDPDGVSYTCDTSLITEDTPAIGTACEDSDSDGICDYIETDVYPSCFTVGTNDFFLNCDNDKWLNGEEIYGITARGTLTDPTVTEDSDGFAVASTSTFDTGAQNPYVYRCDLTSQNLITPDGSGGLDTASITSIDMSCYSSLGVLPTQIIIIGDSLAMIVVQSSAMGTLMDSADVVNRCAIDNECEIDDIRNSDFSEAFLLPKETPKREDPPEPTYASDIWLRVA